MKHATHTQETRSGPVRLLIIPGLHDSGPGHWQSWLQRQYRGAVRVLQHHWDRPELDVWAQQIDHTLQQHDPNTRWVAAAHSFGSLALVHWLGLAPAQARGAISSAWLVAPANPARFGIDRQLHRQGLGIPTQVLGSENDPWMPLDVAREWAQAWGSRFLNLGPVGHINVESGHGAWPWMRLKVDQCLRDQQRELRLQRAHPMELSYAW